MRSDGIGTGIKSYFFVYMKEERKSDIPDDGNRELLTVIKSVIGDGRLFLA